LLGVPGTPPVHTLADDSHAVPEVDAGGEVEPVGHAIHDELPNDDLKVFAGQAVYPVLGLPVYPGDAVDRSGVTVEDAGLLEFVAVLPGGRPLPVLMGAAGSEPVATIWLARSVGDAPVGFGVVGGTAFTESKHAARAAGVAAEICSVTTTVLALSATTLPTDRREVSNTPFVYRPSCVAIRVRNDAALKGDAVELPARTLTDTGVSPLLGVPDTPPVQGLAS